MARSSIIQRWVRGSLLIMVLVLVAAEAIFLYTSYRDLYGGVQRAIESRFSTIAGRLQATGTAGDSLETSESRGQALRRTVEQFDEKDKFEFMLLDARGVVLSTSSGTMSQELSNGADFVEALTSADGEGRAIFTTGQGERVMAVTTLVPYAAGNIAAMRMVTSLTQVDRQWSRYVMASVGIGAPSCGLWARWRRPPPASPGATWPPACRTPNTTTRSAACAGPSTRWRRTWPRPTG